MMDSFGVVKKKPIHEKNVESFQIKKKSLVIVYELFLYGAVESLDVGVHLGSLRVCAVVRDLEFEEPFCKVFLEF